MMAGFFFDLKPVNFKNDTSLIRDLSNTNPLSGLFNDLKTVANDLVSGLDDRNVSTIRNTIQTGVLNGEKVNDIVGGLRASNPNFTEGQFDRADIQKFRDKESEINYRKAQEAHQRLSTQKMKDEMNYLAQTREADKLMAYLKEQALLQGDSAKFGMADIWNSSAVQRALANNSQFKDRALDYYKTNGFLTQLKEAIPEQKFTDLDLASAKLQTSLQKNIAEQELLQSDIGLAPDWNTNPKYKDKAVLLDSLTKGMSAADAVSTKEEFEAKLREVSGRLPDLPMEAKLALVASGINDNWFFEFWQNPYDFSNADNTIERLESLSRRKDRKGQSLLNQIIDYTINNQPAVTEGKELLANKTLQTLRDNRDALIKSIETNPYYTSAQKERLIYNVRYQTEATLPTLMRNLLTAETQSKNLKVGEINNQKNEKAFREYLAELKQKSERGRELAEKYSKMINSPLLP